MPREPQTGPLVTISRWPGKPSTFVNCCGRLAGRASGVHPFASTYAPKGGESPSPVGLNGTNGRFRVLVLTAEEGDGHYAAARAVAQELIAEAQAEVVVQDAYKGAFGRVVLTP